MASITIRNLDEALKRSLRIRAAEHGRSMEEEARDRAEQLVTTAAGSIFDEMGVRPAITVKPGEAIEVVKAMLEEHPEIAALVLGAAAQGAPGPLISHFTGVNAGTLPCPVMVIPGSLSDAQLDELS